MNPIEYTLKNLLYDLPKVSQIHPPGVVSLPVAHSDGLTTTLLFASPPTNRDLELAAEIAKHPKDYPPEKVFENLDESRAREWQLDEARSTVKGLWNQHASARYTLCAILGMDLNKFYSFDEIAVDKLANMAADEIAMMRRPMARLYELANRINVAEDPQIHWTENQWNLIQYGIEIGESRLARDIMRSVGNE